MLRSARFFCLACLLLAACRTEDPDVVQLNLEPPLLVTEEGDTLANAIDDIWVFPDGQLLGVYDAPRTIPLLKTTARRIISGPGVWEDQDPAQRAIYPFVQLDTLPLPDGPLLGSITVRPVFRYFPDTNVVVAFEEQFEEGEPDFLPFGPRTNQTTLERATGGAYTGNGFGRAVFDDERRSLELQSDRAFLLPQNGTNIWLEVAYRSNVQFGVSLIASTLTDVVVPAPKLPGFSFSQDGWTQLYFNLTEYALQSPRGATFRLYLLVLTDGSARTLELDRLRLLYFRPS